MTGQFCGRCAHRVEPGDRFCEWCGAWVAAPRRDHVEADVGVAAGVSDRGRRRRRNEDAIALRDTGTDLAGHARPDEASETAAEVAADAMVLALRAQRGPAAATRHAVHAAARAVAELAADATGVAPACTFVSAVVTGDAITVGWVGDSRAYWIPQDHHSSVPASLTQDDSWLAQVLATGALTPALAAADRRAHAITAWLGDDFGQVEPHVVTVQPTGPGVVVVCTDGLWNYLDTLDEFAAAIPARALDAPLDAARELVEIALHSGGRDNVTVAVLPFAGPRSARHEEVRRDQPA
jgi:serine/threonine protein phosphatase PrpC